MLARVGVVWCGVGVYYGGGCVCVTGVWVQVLLVLTQVLRLWSCGVGVLSCALFVS